MYNMDNINFHMVDQFFQPIISSLPKLLGAIGLFILGFIIAKVHRGEESSSLWRSTAR